MKQEAHKIFLKNVECENIREMCRHQALCGGLNENGPYWLTANGTIRRSGLAGSVSVGDGI